MRRLVLVAALVSPVAVSLNTGRLRTSSRNDLDADIPRVVQDSRQYCRPAYAQPDTPPGKKPPGRGRSRYECRETTSPCARGSGTRPCGPKTNADDVLILKGLVPYVDS